MHCVCSLRGNPRRGQIDANQVTAGDLDTQNFLTLPKIGELGSWARARHAALTSLLPLGPFADGRIKPTIPQRRNVPVPSRRFTGRNAELPSIHGKPYPARIDLSAGAVAVHTHGLGGIGKTELAAKYAHDFALAYAGGVFWLSLVGFEPRDPVQLDQARAAWLSAVQRCFEGEDDLWLDVERKELPSEQVRRRLEQRFQSDERYLWVLDNVPLLRPQDVRDQVLAFWRAPTTSGATLMTSRDREGIGGFGEQRLDTLGPDDALRLLAQHSRKRPSENELDAAWNLLEQVGRHSQALVLMGEWLKTSAYDYSAALDRVRAGGRLEYVERIAGGLTKDLGEKARAIVAIFRINIESLSDEEQRLLLLASYGAPNLPTPIGLLAAAFGGQPKEVKFVPALRRSLSASLLSRRQGDYLASRPAEIHPLVSDCSRRLLEHDPASLAIALGETLLDRISTAGDIRAQGQITNDIGQPRYLAGQLESETGVRLALPVGQYEGARGV